MGIYHYADGGESSSSVTTGERKVMRKVHPEAFTVLDASM